MSVHTLDELHDAFCGPSDNDPGLAVVQQILFQTHDLPSLTHALPVLRDAWTRYLRRNPHPQLLGCILVKAAKQCQLGSQLRFGHFLADLVQAASDALPPRPSSAWPGTYRGEPGAALAQPYVEMTFQSYVVMLSSYNLGDKVLHGLYHWDKLGRPRRIHYVIRHGVACLYYDIDVYAFSLTSSDGICQLPKMFCVFVATSSNRFWNFRPSWTGTARSHGRKTGGKGDCCLSLWKLLSFWIWDQATLKSQLA